MFRRVASRLSNAAVSSSVAAAAGTPTATGTHIDDLSPAEIVKILDRFIIGQKDAKRAVSISLRNRWRRRNITDEGLRNDITPKNILMIGPTGVGKTEISRRMARITDAPFSKVEATKYTEVGFKGKDVESMIEDLHANAKTKARRRLERERDGEAQAAAEDVVFTSYMKHADSLSGSDVGNSFDTKEESSSSGDSSPESLTLESFRARLKDSNDPIHKHLVVIDVTINQPEKKGGGGGAPFQIADLFGFGGGSTSIVQQVTKTVAEAIPIAKTEVLNKLIDDNQVATLAKSLAETEGIIFVDEIDKVIAEASGDGDVSSLGVQQDLLPLIEGSTVTLKDGTQLDTHTILFICSGAFHTVKPSDMIAELQGRLPVRVELQALNEKEFRRILTEPKFNLLVQQQAMLKSEGIHLIFADDGIDALASATARVNAQAQNIGARRLHTIIELAMDEFSYDCEKYENKDVTVTGAHVRETTKNLLTNVDLSRYLM